MNKLIKQILSDPYCIYYNGKRYFVKSFSVAWWGCLLGEMIGFVLPFVAVYILFLIMD